MALLDTAAKLSAPVPEPMWGQVPNEKFLSLKSAFGLLEPELGDLELKRLLVRRVCRAYRAAEGEVIYRLYTEGILPANVATLWSSLPDIDELVAASRADGEHLELVDRERRGVDAELVPRAAEALGALGAKVAGLIARIPTELSQRVAERAARPRLGRDRALAARLASVHAPGHGAVMAERAELAARVRVLEL